MGRNALTFPKGTRNTINRYADRGSYEVPTVQDIVNTCPIVHVSFSPAPDDPFPTVLPMIGQMGSYSHPSASTDEPLDLYLHGYVSSRMMRLARAAAATAEGEEESKSSNGNADGGLPVCVTATHMDGVVLAHTPFNHSYNYRSAVIHGYARPVEDVEEKTWAMRLITNSVVRGRWEQTRVPPTPAELSSTTILRVAVVDASAKVRAKGVGEPDRADREERGVVGKVWAGVVPASLTYGEPVEWDGQRGLGMQVPAELREWIRDAVEGGSEYAENAAKQLYK